MRFVFLILCSLLLVRPAAAMPEVQGVANLTILADSAIIPALSAVARSYSKQQHVALGFAAVPYQVEDLVSQGLEAHAIITANKELLQRLTDRGLVDRYSIRPVIQTRLALVTTRESRLNGLLSKHISFAAVLGATPTIPVLMEPSLSEAGTRSAMLMHGYEFSPTLSARAKAIDSHAALLAELRESNGLALMPANEAAAEPDITILNILPDAICPPLVYTQAILASESMDPSRALMRYLQSDDGQRLLKAQGVEIPTP